MDEFYIRILLVLVMLSSVTLNGRVDGNVTGDGESEIVTLQSGETRTVKSPNFPSNYEDNEGKQWSVEGNKGGRLKITFVSFSTDDRDNLLIKEDTYPHIRANKYSGKGPIPVFVSMGHRLTLSFRPDNVVTKKGFKLSISHFNETSDDIFHKALTGNENTRIMTKRVCRDSWTKEEGDTVCREAGFPGAYTSHFTNGSETALDSGVCYQCDHLSYRLQDCKTSKPEDCDAEIPIIICNLVNLLGCYNLTYHSPLLKEGVEMERDDCVGHCKNQASTPQYAIYHNRTYCSCVSQPLLNIKNVTQDPDRCHTDVNSQNLDWATIFNVSFGFCEEPAPLENGQWQNSSRGYLHGTTITAMCNDDYELVGEDQELKCGGATESSSQDFDWQGDIPTCREILTGTSETDSWSGSVTLTSESPHNASNKYEAEDGDFRAINAISVSIAITISIAITALFITLVYVLRIRQRRKERGRGTPIDGPDQTRKCRSICLFWVVYSGSEPTPKEIWEKGSEPLQEVPPASTQSSTASLLSEQSLETNTCAA